MAYIWCSCGRMFSGVAGSPRHSFHHHLSRNPSHYEIDRKSYVPQNKAGKEQIEMDETRVIKNPVTKTSYKVILRKPSLETLDKIRKLQKIMENPDQIISHKRYW